MQRIDGAYVYELGAKLRPVLTLVEETATKISIYHVVSPAVGALEGFLFNSVYVTHARTVQQSASNLLSELKSLAVDFENLYTFQEEVNEWAIKVIKDKFRSFEAILLAELQGFPLYLVFPKGGFDITCLTDAGASLFPSSLNTKCPEAMDDIVMGARSMAFELWTAMGFHFHRANEAVLRRYYDSVIGSHNRPKALTMGTMWSSMDQNGVGDSNIRVAIKNVIDFHRNPIAHPDHKIADADEALSLYAAIRACLGYMLDKLGSATLSVTTANPVVSAAPLIPGPA